MAISSRTKTLYILRWIKFSKPVYHFGELVIVDGKFIPGPAIVYHSLNLLIQTIKNRHQKFKINIITMGLTKDERNVIDRFKIGNPQISGIKHIQKPLGKKSDGSLFRVFLVDNDFSTLKDVKEIIVPQHFELVSIARTGLQAYEFYSKQYKNIDILFVGLQLNDCTGYQLIEEFKKFNRDLITIVMVYSEKDIDAIISNRLHINFHIKKPVVKSELLDKIKRMLS